MINKLDLFIWYLFLQKLDLFFDLVTQSLNQSPPRPSQKMWPYMLYLRYGKSHKSSRVRYFGYLGPSSPYPLSLSKQIAEIGLFNR